MAIITKTTAGQNVTTSTLLPVSGRATTGADVVLIGSDTLIGGTIDLAGGIDELRFNNTTGAQVYDLGGFTFGATGSIETVSLGTGTVAVPVLTGTTAHAIDASDYVLNGLTLLGNAGANLITGTFFADAFTGGGGSDTLYGGAGNDTFTVATLADYGAGEEIDGEDGFDTLQFNNTVANATLTLNVNTNVEAVNIGGTVAGNVNATAVSADLGLRITGNAAANAITGSALGDTLIGAAGADNLSGLGGNDVFLITLPTEYLTGASALVSDQINGGLGTDAIRFISTTAGQTLTLNAFVTGVERLEIANQQGQTHLNTALNVDAKALAAGMTIVGNAGSNSITGTQAADTIQGGGGNDFFLIGTAAHHAAGESIDGGAGTDIIRFTQLTAGTLTLQNLANVETAMISDAAGGGASTIASSIDASNVGYGISLVGNSGANSLTGGAGSDTLNGGTGNDTLQGGGGNDVYLYTAVGQFGATEVVNDSGGANDILRIAAGTLTAGTGATAGIQATGVETIELLGATATTAIGVVVSTLETDSFRILGNAGANAITAGGGSDTISGGLGTDVLKGGAGDDVFLVGAVAELTGDTFDGGTGNDVIRLTAATGTYTFVAGMLGMEEIEISDEAGSNAGGGAVNINAAAFGATVNGVRFTGNAGNNSITGGAGADLIEGGGGNDNLKGGAGNDTFIYASSAHYAGDTVDGGLGTDTILFNGTVNGDTLTLAAGTLGIEAVSMTGSAGLAVDASALAAALKLSSNGGGDTITGGAGNDTFSGGAGDDLFLVKLGAHHGATESMDGGADTDTLRFTSTLEGDTLFLSAQNAGVELLQVADAAGNASGTTSLNIYAAAANNAVTMTGNAGDNQLTGGRFNDFVDGGYGNDLLNGGSGDDTLSGGAGADTLIGGAGNDQFNDIDTSDSIIAGRGDDDRIAMTGSGGELDLTLVAPGSIIGVERVDITGTGNNTLVVDGAIVLDMVGTGGTLTVDGDAGDELTSDDNWVQGANASGYTDFTFGGVTIHVNNNVNFSRTFTATAGTDNLVGSTSGDTFRFPGGVTMTLGDTVDGGGGNDTMSLEDGGTFDMTQITVTSIEVIRLEDGTVATLIVNDINNHTYTINVGGAGTGTFDITLGDVTGSGAQNVTTGTGNDTITLGAGQNIVSTGDGADVVLGTVEASDEVWLQGGNDSFAFREGLAGLADGGAGTDTLTYSGGTGTVTIDLSATSGEAGVHSNFENLSAGGAAADLVVTAAAAGSDIATGTGDDSITAGAGNDTVDAGAGADVIYGQAAGDDVDLGADGDQATYVAGATVTGGSGDDLLLVASGSGALTIALGEGANIAGYSSFEDLDGSAADGALTVTAASTGSSIQTGGAADSITLGAGYDEAYAGAGNDTIHATASTFYDGEFGDWVDGGTDSDTLAFTGGGSIDLNNGFVTGIENVTIDDSATTFTANDDAMSITAGNGGNTIILGGESGAQSVTTGSGADSVALGSGANDIDMGGGSDTVTGTVNADDDVDLGDGADSYTYNAANTGIVRGGGDASADTLVFNGGSLTLDLSSGGNQALSGTGDYRGFENLNASGASGTVDVTVGAGSTSIVATGSGGDTIRVNSTTILGVTIDGGGGSDTLVVTGGNTVSMAAVSGIENVTIDDNATTLAANNDNLDISAGDGGNTITLGSGTQSVSTGDGADSVALGGGTNLVNTGGGSDTVTGTVQAADQVNLGAGSDSFGFVSIAGSVDGGADSDTLTYSGGTATINLSATTASAGVYSNFENLSASGATGNLTVTAAAAGGSIATGSGHDLIALGAGIDSVTGGSGNDTVTGALTAGDSVNLGSNSDTATYSGGVSATLDGGSGNDTLVVSGGSGTLAIDLSLGGDQIAGDGATVTQGFENLSAAAAAYNIAVTLASGSSSIVLGTGNDTIIATDAQVVAATTIDGGAGANTLQVTDTASLADADFTNVSSVQTLQLANAGGAQSVTLGTEAQQAGIVTLNASAATQSVSVNAAAYTVGVSITTGSAGDSITLGGSGADTVDAGGGADTVTGVGTGDSVSLGAGNDTFTYASVAATVDGGADVDTLITTSGSAFTINLGLVGADQVSTGLGDYRNFENLDASGASGAIDVTVGANTTSVSTGGAGDSIRVSAGAVGVAAIDGNGGTDTLFITGSGTVTLTNVSDVEAIDISGGSVTFTADGDFAISSDNNAQTIILGTGTQSVTTGSGGDHITLGSGTNVVNTNGGTDTVVGALSAGDTINLGAGNDSYTYSVTAASNTIDGGADVDTLVYTGSADIVIDFTTTADNIATELGAYRNFENLSAGSASGDITVISTSGPGSFSITTGSGDDNVTTGTGDDSIDTGAGSDTVLGAVGANDVVNLGAGLDSYAHQVILGVVDGGTSSDTLTYNGAFADLYIDFSNATDHFANGSNPAGAQSGFYRNFENLNVLGGNTTNIAVIAATAGGTITTGDGNDLITLGSGTDIISGAGGNDTVTGAALGSGEVIALGTGEDHFGYLATVDISNIINGQGGNDWLDYSGSASLSIDFSATADNIAAEAGTYAGFENLGFGAAGGNYIVVAATTGSIINTGSGTDSVTVGAGTDTVDTGGNSDTVSGALTTNDNVSLGADADTYNFALNVASTTISGGSGGTDSDTMVVTGGSAIGFTLALNQDGAVNQVSVTGAAGEYYEFEHLSAGTAAYNFTVTANAAGSSIVTGSGTDLITAGAGNDTVDAGSSNDTINLTSSTYAGDSYTGGLGTDRLAITGGGTVDLGAGVTVTGFEDITLDANATTLTSDGDGYSITAGDVTGGGGHYVDLVGGSNTVSTGAGNDTVNLGTGNDLVDMGDGSDSVEGTLSGNDNVSLGAGTDTFVWQVLTNAANVVSGGSGSDTLEITLSAAEAGTSSLEIEFDLADQLIGGQTTGTYTAFENLDASSTDIDLTVTAYSGGATTITTGSGDDTVYLDASQQTISTGEGADSVAGGLTAGDTVDLGAEDDSFGYAVSGATNVVDGGDGDDWLVTSGATSLSIDFSTVLDNISSEDGTYLNFENLDATASSGGYSVIAATTGSVIYTGSGFDEVEAGAGADDIATGDGNDNIYVSVGNHAGDSYDGGADTDTLHIDGTGAIDLTGGAGNATATGIEQVFIEATAGSVSLLVQDGDVNVYAYNNAGNTITFGAGEQDYDTNDTAPGANDTINLGEGANFVYAGTGSDVVNGTVESTDEIRLEEGNDSFVWQTQVGMGLVDGGDGTDTITHTGEGSFSLDLSLTSAEAGYYTNFENLAASGADDAIEVYAASGGSNIATGAGGDNIHVAGGNDTVSAGAGMDGIYVNAFTGNSVGDSVDGGGDTDTLYVSGDTGALYLGEFASLVNVEEIVLSDETLLLVTDEQGFTITAVAGEGAQSVDLGLSDNDNTVSLGDGNDEVTLGGAADDVDMGDGSDDVAGDLSDGDDVDMGAGTDGFELGGRLYDANSTISGGGGNDVLTYGGGNDIVVDLGAAGDQVAFFAGVQTGFEDFDGGASSDNLAVTAGASTSYIYGGSGNDTITVSAAQLNGALEVDGSGDGTEDYLVLNTAASGADTIGDGAFSDVSGIEGLSLGAGANQVLQLGETATGAGIYYVDASATGNVSITNLADNRSMTSGTGNDFFALYGADEIVVAGAGNDTVYGATNDALDQVFLQGDSDTYTTTLSDNEGLVDGGAGSDWVVYNGSGAASFNLSPTVAGAGVYSNFENFDGSAAGSGVNVTVSGANGEIIGSSSGDSIVVGGTGNDTIYAGGGSDTVTGTLSSADQVYLETGDDSFVHQALGAGALVDAGEGLDTLIVGSEQGFLTIDLTALDQVSGTGTYANFENVDGSGADDALDITISSASDSISGGGNNDVVRVNSGTFSTVSVNGGLGTDTLDITGGGTFDLNAVGIYVANIEVVEIDDAATTFVSNGYGYDIFGDTAATGGHTITLTAGTNSVTLGDSNDTVNLGSGADNVNTGDGVDVVNGNLSAGDVVDLGLGNDSFNLSTPSRTAAAGSTVNGGGGTDTLVFNGTSGVSPTTVNFTSGTDQVAGGDAGDADYLGFENLDFGGSDDAVNVTLSAATTSVIASDGGDTITDANDAGEGVQTIMGMDGNDTLNTTSADFIGDSLNGGAGGNDLISFTGGGSFNMNSASISGFEQITIDSTGTTFTANNDALAITITGVGPAPANTVTLGNNSLQTLYVDGTLESDDTVNLGAQGQSVFTSKGDDEIYTSATDGENGTFFSSINAGEGLDTVYVEVGAGGFALSMPGAVDEAEVVDFTGTNGVYFTLDSTLGLTARGVDGGNGDELYAGEGGGQVLDGRGGDDYLALGEQSQQAHGGLGNDTIAVNDYFVSGSTITGGGGNDLLSVSTVFGSFDMNNGSIGFDIEDVTLNEEMNFTANADTDLTITGSAGNDLIVMGDGNQVVNAGLGNDTVSVTDAYLDGTLDVDGQDGDDLLEITGTASVVDADFGTTLDDFLYLRFADGSVQLGANAAAVGFTGVSGTVSTNDLTINAEEFGSGGLTISTFDGDDHITLNLGLNIVQTSGGNDTISTTVANYAGDTIDGGNDTDTLRIYGAAGSISVNKADANVEDILLDTANTITLTLTGGEGFSVTASAADGDHVVNLGSNSASSFNGAGGDETVTLGAGEQSASMGDGADTINSTAGFLGTSSGTNIDGGAGGNDVLNVTSGGTVDFDGGGATINGVETINLNANGITLLADTDTYTINGFDGGTGDTIVLGASTQVVNAQGGDDTVSLLSGILSGDPVLSGGNGNDVLQISDAGTNVDADFTNILGFEVLSFGTAGGSVTLGTEADEAGFTTVNGSAATSGITITVDDTLFDNGLSITTGSGMDNLNLGDANVETVFTGAGNDQVQDFSAGDNVSLEGDDDTAQYEQVAATIDGGAGTDWLVLDVNDAVDGQVFDFTLADQNGTLAGAYSNFENINGSASDDDLVIIGNAGTTKVHTGSADDSITLNSMLTDTSGGASDFGNGDDTLTASNANFAGSSFGMGGQTGSDVVVITDTASLAGADFSGKTGIEMLRLTGQSGVVTHTITLSDTAAFNGTGISVIQGNLLANDILVVDAGSLGAGGSMTVVGASGNDTMTFSDSAVARDEQFNGNGGDDTALTNGSLGAFDIIQLGDGNDTVRYAALGGGGSVDGSNDVDTIDDFYGFGGTFDFSTSINLLSGAFTYSNFENLTGTTSTNAYTITLAASSTSILTGSGNDTINVTASTLNAGDTIDANGGTDQLNINGAGTFTLTSTNAQEFEVIQDDASVDATTLVMNDLASVTINMDGGNDTITLSSSVASQTVNGGAGDDVINVGFAGQTVNAGADSDTVHVTSGTIASTLDGGSTGTNVDTLQVNGGGNVTMGGAITEFEVVSLAAATNFTANSDSTLTINGSENGDTITIGDANQVVNADSGDDVIRATNAQLNAVMTDLNGGTHTAGDKLTVTTDAALLDDDFTNMDGIEILELTASGNAQSLTLAAEAAGAGLTSVTVNSTAPTGAISVNASGFGATALSITTGDGNDGVTANAGGGVITTNGGDDIINLTTGANTVFGGSGNDTMGAGAGGVDAGDSLDGGSGTADVLVLTDGTSYNLTTPAAVTGIEIIQDDLTEGTTLTLNAAAYTVYMAAGSDTVTMGNNASQTVYGGAGDDFVTLGAAGQTVQDEGAGGDGQDTISVNSTTVASTIDGGSTSDGTGDVLLVTGGGTVNMSSGTITNMEIVTLFDAGGTDFTANTDSTLTINGHNGGNDTITLGDGAQVVNGDGGNDVVIVTDGMLDGTLDVDGGAGSDVLQLSNAASIADADFGADVDSFEELRFAAAGGSATLDTNADAAGFTAVNGSLATSAINVTFAVGFDNNVTVTGGSAGDSFTLSGANQSIDGGGGADTIHATDALFDANLVIDGEAGTDVINLGNGDVAITDDDFTGITGVETLLVGDGTSGHSLVLAGEAGDSGLNLVNATAADFQVTVDASGFTGANLTINTGSAGDVITITTGGGTVETVDAGGGADTVNGALSNGDNVSLGAGTDTYNFGINVANTTISGGADDDLLVVGEGSAIAFGLDLDAAGNQVTLSGASGNYLAFNDLMATGSNYVFTVNAHASGSNINTGDAADSVTAGAGADNIVTELSDDTINITNTTYAGDTLDGGGGTGDTLAITGGGTVDLSTGVTVTGIENITIGTTALTLVSDGDGYIITGATASAGGHSITLTAGINEVQLGASNDTVNLGSGDDDVSMGDGSDTVLGLVQAGDIVNLDGGNDSYTFNPSNSGLIGGGEGLDTLLVGSEAGALTIDFTSGGDQVSGTGSYVDFENLSASGADSAIDVTVDADSTSIVTGTADDTVRVTSTTVLGVTINGTSGTTDTLAVTGGGAISMAAVSNMDLVTIDDNATQLTANNETLTITAGDGGNTIVLGSGTQTVNGTLAGNDAVTLGSGANNVATGGGDDTINLSSTTYSGDTLDGGGNTDTLAISGGTVNLNSATVSNFEVITLGTTAVTLTSDGDGYTINGAAASVGGHSVTLTSGTNTVTLSTSNDTVVLGTGNDTVNTGGGSDTVTGTLGGTDSVDLNDDNDTFTYQFLNTGTLVNGGNGSDTLTVTGNTPLTIDFSITTDNIAAEDGAYRNFENLSGGSAIGAFNVTAAAAGSTITTGSAGDIVNLGVGSDVVATGLGSDTVNGSLTDGDTVDLGGNNDSFAFVTAGFANNIVDGGADSDTLSYGGASALTVNFLTTTDNVAAETGAYRNFENLAASGATGAITVTDGNGNNVIETGSNGDTFIVSGTSTSGGGDVFNAGGGTDKIQVNGGTVSMLVGSWTSFEQVEILQASTFVANATSGLQITGSSGVDDVTLGASNQTVSLGGDNDILRLSAATGMPSTLNGGSGTGDTIVLSGGGSYTMAVGVTGFEILYTGTTLATVILNNTGYAVNVQGGVDHNLTSGNNSGGDDSFIFEGPRAQWAGVQIDLDGFLQGAGNDKIDLTAFGTTVYGGEATAAGVDAALSGNGAVYDIDFFRLIVDINGNGSYEVGSDLTINLGATVTDLTAGTDLLVL